MPVLQVQDAIQLKYSQLSTSESLLQWTEQLTTFYLKSPRFIGHLECVLSLYVVFFSST